MKLSITDIIYPISTYHGNLCHDYMDSEIIENDIQEGYLPDNNLPEYKNIDYNDIPDDHFFNYTAGLADIVKNDIENHPKIIKALKKYGLKYNGISFWSPKAYNFQGDSIDIDLEVIKDCKDKLKKEIEEYIETKRQKSYDGYCSLEPNSFEEVSTDDYAYLWAVFKKENLLDDIKDIIESMVEDSYETYSNCFMEGLYTWLETIPEYKAFKKIKDQEEFNKNNQYRI